MIFPYNPRKTKPMKWKGSLPPSWYVTHVVIPQPAHGNSVIGDIGHNWWYIDAAQTLIGVFTGHPNGMQNYFRRPGQGDENRAYWNQDFNKYIEWHYTNPNHTQFQVNLFDGYEFRNGTWRGTNKQGYYIIFDLLDDGSWEPDSPYSL
jgi:hypothetical protein